LSEIEHELHASERDAHKIGSAIVIVLGPEQSRPVIADTCRSPEDRARILAWVASQPQLLELYVRALRLGGYDAEGVLDGVCEEEG
jgi:hypothetical protein